MGVVNGPFRAILTSLILSKVSSGSVSPCFSKAPAPASMTSQFMDTPAASITFCAAAVTSGPIPSPGIKTALCDFVFAIINPL